MRDDLPVTPLHRSLLVPVLIFGIERQAVVPVLGLAAALLFGFRLNFVTPTLAILLLTLGLPALRRWHRHDPWAFQVFRRHLRVAGFYPPLARHDTRRRRTPTF